MRIVILKLAWKPVSPGEQEKDGNYDAFSQTCMLKFTLKKSGSSSDFTSGGKGQCHKDIKIANNMISASSLLVLCDQSLFANVEKFKMAYNIVLCF